MPFKLKFPHLESSLKFFGTILVSSFMSWSAYAGVVLTNGQTYVAGSPIINTSSGGSLFNLTANGAVVASFVNNSSLYQDVNGGNVLYIYGDANTAITSLVNNGLMYAYGGNAIDNHSSPIVTFTNNGSIVSASGVGINNSRNGTIVTLNNLQGVGSSYIAPIGVAGAYTGLALSSTPSGPLRYSSGSLPSNYNIIINGTNNYGQLSVTSVTGSMAFNIYGNTGTTLVSGVGASTVQAYRYLNVLQGFSSLTSISGVTGTYGGYNYSLVADATLADSWDLLVYIPGPSSDYTQASLQLSANTLKGVYALQTSAIANGLTYDCNVFNKEGICVSAGGRYDRVNTGNTHATNGLLIGSYRVDANTRVGAWVDQNLSARSATGVNLNNGNPMFGVFGVWNADKSVNGFEVRLSAGYGDKDLTVTRQVVGASQASEAGTGKTRLNTQGASAVVSYNFPVATDLTASPYLGVRYTRVNANAYTEASSTDVTAPLTYSALKQETTTALAGLKFSARMSPECGVFGSVGAELDTSNKGNNYSATGVDGLTDIALNPDAKRLRGVASIGTYYDIDKTQRVSLNAVYREETFQRTNTLSTMATYTAGF